MPGRSRIRSTTRPVSDRLNLPARHREQLESLFREHLPDVEVWAYGSRVDGRSHDGSDLDLVLRGPGLEGIDLMRLGDFQQALHDSTIPFVVEARDWARLPERFHREIEGGYVVLVGKQVGREWPRVRVEEIAEKVAMGPFGSSIKVETFVDRGVPVINGKHLHGRRLDVEVGFDCISEEHADRLANANVGPGDIVFTHRGTIGQVSIVPRGAQYERYVVSQSQMYLRCNESKMLPEFAAQWFAAPEGRHALLANASQVGVPSIAQPASYVKTILIPLPQIDEQRAIGHILGTLDDKIELNRRTSETLEAMARAVFDSWFVNFDPVHTKVQGRVPCLADRVASLFPDSFVGSETGDVPTGWEIVPLTEIMDVNPTRRLRKGDVAPYLGMSDMPARGHCPDSVAERPYGSGMRFVNGDTLLARITPCLENGKTAYVDFLSAGETGWGSTEYIVMRPKPPLPTEFAYCLARSSAFRHYAIKNMTGTSGRQRVSAAALAHFRLPAPPVEIAVRFGVVARDLLERASKASRESQALRALRDALLSPLLSGSLRVSGFKERSR